MSDFIIENGILIKYKGTESDLVIPDGVTGIGDKAFWKCTNLKSVTLPEGVTQVRLAVATTNRNQLGIGDIVAKIQ